tara:strand:+ start:6303 stop:7442 length:1140 start_codon:yes stop_codon:yes gene_type:complete
MPHAEFHLPHSWKYFLHSPLNQLYLSLAVRAFAFSIISLFVPAYLYGELGYSLTQVFTFFIVYALTLAFSSPFFILFSTKIGFKHTIMLSIPLQMGYFYLLHILAESSFSLFWVAFVLGLGLASFNAGLHLEFHAISHPKSRGEEVGKRQAAQFIGLMFGPLIGGGLIHYLGFTVVFWLVGFLLLFSGFFLFLSKEHRIKLSFSWKKFFGVYNNKLALYYLYRGAWVIATGVLWPLYIFLELGDYLSLGVIGTLMALVTAFLVFFLGKKSDSFGKHRVVQYSAIPEAIVWIFRGFVASFAGIIGMSLFQSLTSSALEAPLLALEYNHANDNNAVLEYFMWRQFIVGMGRVLLISFMLVVGSFMASFAFVGLGTFFVFLL